MKYVAVCGTFDKLHDGHKRLIEEAIIYTRSMDEFIDVKLCIYVAGDKYAQNKRKGVAPYEYRVKLVRKFVDHYIDEHLNCCDTPFEYEVDEYFEPMKRDIYCVVTSKDTIKESVIYRDRFEPNMLILVAPTVFGDDGEPISSTKLSQVIS